MPHTIASLDPRSLPPSLTTRHHLILNTPATIDFNSPGAQGFGVKRAGLTVPGSLMLLISPACCGRNTRALSGPGRYGERFAYLELTTTDIVTGAHLKKIPEAARLFLESRTDRPSCLLLCTTCVDALLGTDMDRIARQTEALIHLPTRPCYMYALTRESLHPPMVQVRETIASLLKEPPSSPQADRERSDHFRPLGAACSPQADKERSDSLRGHDCIFAEGQGFPKDSVKESSVESVGTPVPPPCHEPPSATTNTAVNLLGSFTPIDPASDLFPLLRTLGYDAPRQLSTCRTYADFQTMAASALNLVLTPESLPAAEAMATRLHIPYITLRRFYTPSRIHKQYQALARALGRDLDDTAWYDQACAAIHHLKALLRPPETPCSPQADSEQSERFRPLGASPAFAKTSPSSGGRGLCDSERSGEHPSGAEKNNKAALKNTTSDSPSSPRTIAREDSPLSESTQSPRPTATTNDPSRPRTIALGSRLNADPLDLALLLTSCGFTITDIITTLDASDTCFLTLLQQISPNTRLHGALDPSMADFHPALLPDLTLGADAATYYPGVPNIPWNEEIQPFGYQAPITLLKAIQTALHLS